MANERSGQCYIKWYQRFRLIVRYIILCPLDSSCFIIHSPKSKLYKNISPVLTVNLLSKRPIENGPLRWTKRRKETLGFWSRMSAAADEVKEGGNKISLVSYLLDFIACVRQVVSSFTSCNVVVCYMHLSENLMRW